MTENAMYDSNLKRLHIEWLNSIEACLSRLHEIDSLTRQWQIRAHDVDDQSNLSELRYRIFVKRNALSLIARDVVEFKKKLEARSDKHIISIADVIENNRLREKVIKAEQSVFVLNHEATQLLSRAS